MMRTFSLSAGVLGALSFLMAVAGRFHEESTISLLGHRFQSLTFLVLANTFLVAGIYLHLLGGERRAR
jgi:hypothetical protein